MAASAPEHKAGDGIPQALVDKVAAKIDKFEDFPKPGVTFRDLHPLMADAEGRAAVCSFLKERFADQKVDAVVGMESRGYYFGLPLAIDLGVPFVPLRKPKKLPGELVGVDFGTEYSRDRLELQTDKLAKGSRVVVCDDLLATGGTAVAACELMDKVGAEIVEVFFIIELLGLAGRKKAPEGVKWSTLLTYE